MDINAVLSKNGDMVQMGDQWYRRKMRWYTLNLVRSAVVSAQFVGTILIDPSNTPFLLTSMHADDTADSAVLTTQEPWFIQITDNENGYLWADGAAPRASVFSDRIFGFQPPDMTALKANTRITFVLTNRAAGAVAGTATICLRGWTLIGAA